MDAEQAKRIKHGLLGELSIYSYQPDQRLVDEATGCSPGQPADRPAEQQFLPPCPPKPPPSPFIQPRREAFGPNGFRQR